MEDEKHIRAATPPDETPEELTSWPTPQEEAELLAGFLSRKPAGELAFVNALRPFFRAVIRRSYPALWEESQDLQQSAVLRLLELREQRDPEKRIQPPLFKFVTYLLDAPAHVLLRARKKFVKVRDSHRIAQAAQDAWIRLNERLELAESLPRGMADTIRIHAAYEMGNGPPLHEVLRIDERSARRRLFRAREALWELTDEDKND